MIRKNCHKKWTDDTLEKRKIQKKCLSAYSMLHIFFGNTLKLVMQLENIMHEQNFSSMLNTSG